MALNLKDIEKISNLARLEISSDQANKVLMQMNEFFEIVAQMRSVDTSGIEPLAHPTHAMAKQTLEDRGLKSIELRLRPDIVSELNERDLNQRSAPAVERGLFLVPKVIE
jgi:aspartyl-tRNA(Asn)/glutamyl-tRNA(Gln) amidotransferase subunit C